MAKSDILLNKLIVHNNSEFRIDKYTFNQHTIDVIRLQDMTLGKALAR